MKRTTDLVIGDSLKLRAWLDQDGQLRVCRDVQVSAGGMLQPVHAVTVDAAGGIVWKTHDEGAYVPPLRGEPR